MNYFRGIFKKTNYFYDKRISPRCRYSKHRGESYGRIEYYLPSGQKMSFYKIPIELKRGNSKLRTKYLKEFEKHLRAGHFPDNAVKKMNKTYLMDETKGKRTKWEEAIELYYTTLNKGKWRKSNKTIENEKSTLIKQITYFKYKHNIHYINDLNNEHLNCYNRDVEEFKSRGGKSLIKKSTQKSYKKMFKSFLNCCVKPFCLELDLCELDMQIYNKGKPDSSLYCRTTVIPKELLGKVDDCSYITPDIYPDRKELVNLLRNTGICKDELSCLGEENLYYNDSESLYQSKKDFNALRIFDKPECPTNHKDGFTVKSVNRNRVIQLDNRSISFIRHQLEIHSNNKIFGKSYTGTFIEYRFIFPIFRDERWVRCSSFLRGIQSILKVANEEFSLGYSEKYTIHDFRNTRNVEMANMGIDVEVRSDQLGHSKKVNEKNYYSLSEKKEHKRRKSFHVLGNKITNFEDNLYYLDRPRGVQ